MWIINILLVFDIGSNFVGNRFVATTGAKPVLGPKCMIPYIKIKGAKPVLGPRCMIPYIKIHLGPEKVRLFISVSYISGNIKL